MSMTDLPTPIPLGSPRTTVPPTFNRWAVNPRRANRQDKRDYSRRDVQCDVWLADISSASVLRCKTDNISDAGLHGNAPIGFGMAIGQRYEVSIAQIDGAHGPIGRQIAKTLGYGTVIRTEIQVGGARPDRVGFALRFDSPRLIPI